LFSTSKFKIKNIEDLKTKIDKMTLELKDNKENRNKVISEKQVLANELDFITVIMNFI
jgi:hypothetical protein